MYGYQGCHLSGTKNFVSWFLVNCSHTSPRQTKNQGKIRFPQKHNQILASRIHFDDNLRVGIFCHYLLWIDIYPCVVWHISYFFLFTDYLAPVLQIFSLRVLVGIRSNSVQNGCALVRRVTRKKAPRIWQIKPFKARRITFTNSLSLQLIELRSCPIDFTESN